ncbi:MAG: transcription termination factor NusA [Pseudomonadota bacterium]|jgi:N utilization substance protein A|nr:transcription termination factor NusA [Alphaproteobacteria bacterium]
MASRKLKPVEDTVQHPRHELIQVADVVAREKGIDREEVIVAMELAMQRTAKQKYGMDHDIRAIIDRETGHVQIIRCLEVAEEIEDPINQVTIETAKLDYPDAKIGDVLEEELPPLEFGRIAAQSARQIIFQKVRDAERSRQYEEFKNRLGDVVNALVKRVEFGNVVVDLGKAEGILKKDDLIPRESYRVGDRVRAIIHDLKPDSRGPMVILSRTHPKFMAKLFEQEVPEIYDNVIEIKSVARDPGSRAKMAVYTTDPNLDPIGSCVGMRGSRVQVIVNELQGEKVDIINWTNDPATFVVNALAPAEISRVVIDEDQHRIDVVVAEEQLSLAIGRRGQNVRLASQLTGWKIDIITENDDISRRAQENESKMNLFIEALDIDEMFAQLLISEGFETIEEIATIDIDEFLRIDGIDEDTANELQARGKTYLENFSKRMLEKCKELGVEKDMYDLGLTPQMLVKLAEKSIKNREELAELAGDELQETIGAGIIDIDAANAVIMKAREHWFN